MSAPGLDSPRSADQGDLSRDPGSRGLDLSQQRRRLGQTPQGALRPGSDQSLPEGRTGQKAREEAPRYNGGKKEISK